MNIDRKIIEKIYNDLSPEIKDRVEQAGKLIVQTKKKGRKVIAAVGSGPNLHEGVTTLIAELMHKGIIDGVCISSAVVSHEMAGTLDRVKRADGLSLGFKPETLPGFGFVEATILSQELLEQYKREISINTDLYNKMLDAPGDVIIKAAGNMGYPGGLRTEQLASDILKIAKKHSIPFEQAAGYGADPMTLIGAGARLSKPVLVTVPQLVGGGNVGLAIGDSISISERSLRIAKLLDSADVIIESAIALCQEIHDGPFETYTGHGIWSDWEEGWTFSLANKKLIRIDLDPNLENAWLRERKNKEITKAVKKGFPKAKVTGLPFRMEMSGFSRIPGSLPIICDIGTVWPVLATLVAEEMNIPLDFMSYNQSLKEGQKMREWIVENIHPVDRDKVFKNSATLDK
jgi:hypothetical protein